MFVIDDQAAVRHALGEMLQVFGYCVRTFESADAFLAALTADETGCIVADVRTASQSLRTTLLLGGTVKEPQVRN